MFLWVFMGLTAWQPVRPYPPPPGADQIGPAAGTASPGQAKQLLRYVHAQRTQKAIPAERAKVNATKSNFGCVKNTIRRCSNYILS